MFPEGGVEFYGWPLQTSYFSRVIELSRKARLGICVAQYVFGVSSSREWQRSNKVFNELVYAHRRGVKVSVLLDRPREHAPNTRANMGCAKRFFEEGVEVRALAVPRTLHLKMLVFDNEFFLAGSHNLTSSSLYSPFELTFECRDPVLVNAAGIYFSALWNGRMSEPFFDAEKRLRKRGV
jgi:phosphatidylserine/phosphatidylglycerophosphate/cardiolipin synthase-like enzyme